MTLELKPIEVASVDREGQLILFNGVLVGVLVKLSSLHGELSGRWHLETGYDGLRDERLTFADLDAAKRWINDRLSDAAPDDATN
jgi:hypothetical protein